MSDPRNQPDFIGCEYRDAQGNLIEPVGMMPTSFRNQPEPREPMTLEEYTAWVDGLPQPDFRTIHGPHAEGQDAELERLRMAQEQQSHMLTMMQGMATIGGFLLGCLVSYAVFRLTR